MPTGKVGDVSTKASATQTWTYHVGGSAASSGKIVNSVGPYDLFGSELWNTVCQKVDWEINYDYHWAQIDSGMNVLCQKQSSLNTQFAGVDLAINGVMKSAGLGSEVQTIGKTLIQRYSEIKGVDYTWHPGQQTCIVKTKGVSIDGQDSIYNIGCTITQTLTAGWVELTTTPKISSGGVSLLPLLLLALLIWLIAGGKL